MAGATWQIDGALDAGVDRLGELVAGKLGADPALVKLESEAAAGEVSQRTRDRVRLAVEDASEDDPGFATAVADALRQLQVATAAAGGGAGETTVLGGGMIRAEGGSNAAWSITGPVTIGTPPPAAAGPEAAPPDPSLPGRP